MSRKTSLFLLLGLIGCAPQIVGNFTPYAVEVSNSDVFKSDLQICRKYAKDYLSGKDSLDASQIAQEGATAGFNDLGYSAISPIAPALGALGGASGEVLNQLGLNSSDGKKIVTVCLHDKGQMNNSYHIYDPHL